eukprot:jgi/Bigna1/128454/aug1.6_g3162
MVLGSLLTLALLSWTASPNADVYSIKGTILLPRNSKPNNVRLTLNGGKYVGIPQSNGKFIISGLSPGTYYMEIQSTDYEFSPVRVDISGRDKGKVRAMTADPMKRKERIQYPLSLRPIGKTQYFEVHKAFNPLNLLKNPMALMMGAMMLVMLLTRFIDPEELKKMQAAAQQEANGRGAGGGRVNHAAARPGNVRTSS